MKKGFFIVAITIFLVFSGCAPTENRTSSLQDSSAETSQSQELLGNSTSSESAVSSESDMDAIIDKDDVGLPKMSGEYQSLYDQYIEPYISAGILLSSFSKDNATFFNANRVYSRARRAQISRLLLCPLGASAIGRS